MYDFHKMENHVILFQLRFKLSEDGDFHNHAEFVFEKNAKRVAREVINYGRIQANKAYLEEIKGQRVGTKRAASSMYLTEEELK
jgi:hypothetical protein